MRVQALTGPAARRHLAVHLVTRFLGAVSPGGPSAVDETWVAGLLGAETASWDLWHSMSGPDRRHAVGVARRVARVHGEESDVLAAALLHDVGKVTAGIGTLGRVPATLIGLAGGRTRAEAWSATRIAPLRRLGRYLRHDEEGATLLASAGAAPLVVAWAREHHRSEARWTVPLEVGRRLKEADDD